MNPRFAGRYEVRKMDKWNWAVYEVMPEGFDNSKAKYTLANDGRALRHTGTYHPTAAAAVRKVERLLIEEHMDAAADAAELAEMLERHERRMSGLAERIGAAVEASA